MVGCEWCYSLLVLVVQTRNSDNADNDGTRISELNKYIDMKRQQNLVCNSRFELHF